MSCYRARAISRNDIQQFVRWLKREIGMERVLYFPIMQFLEIILFVLIPDFQLEIVPIGEMGNKHGETFPSRKLICIREDVYLRACAGYGRDRLTIAHEIGHLLLHDEETISLCRIIPMQKLKAYEDPEWQANAFGGELLASTYLICGMSADEVARKCGVSISAAKVQLRSIAYRGGLL